MGKAKAILLLIPLSLAATLIAAMIYGLLIATQIVPGAWSKLDGLLAAAAFVAIPMGLGSSLVTVPLSLVAFPLAFRLRPPRGRSAWNWSRHGAALGASLAVCLLVLVTAGLSAYMLQRDGRIGDQWKNDPGTSLAFLVFCLLTGIITGALYGLTKHKLARGGAEA